MKVSISAYTAGAAITPVATTTSTGTFSFTTAPGTYYLVIGSDSTTDTTSLHTKISLVAGTNALTLTIPPAETDVTYTAAQLSGNFRLTALSGDQLSCFTGANAGRASLSLSALIPDEIMPETSTAFSQEAGGEGGVGERSPLFNNLFAYEPKSAEFRLPRHSRRAVTLTTALAILTRLVSIAPTRNSMRQLRT